MTAIWENDGTGWRLMAPSGFPDEASLHALVEQAPHILQLAGGPRLVVLGREVLLGANWADRQSDLRGQMLMSVIDRHP